jgi:hypothetical protein
MTLRKSLTYFLIFTVVASFFTYRIVVRAYDTAYSYDIDALLQ